MDDRDPQLIDRWIGPLERAAPIALWKRPAEGASPSRSAASEDSGSAPERLRAYLRAIDL